jgi:hypothetical protein
VEPLKITTVPRIMQENVGITAIRTTYRIESEPMERFPYEWITLRRLGIANYRALTSNGKTMDGG